jgi:hypothetical protein
VNRLSKTIGEDPIEANLEVEHRKTRSICPLERDRRFFGLKTEGIIRRWFQRRDY